MNEKLIAILDLTPAVSGQPISEQQIIDAVANLKKQVADFAAQQEQAAADDELIAQKMRKGLSREQAVMVINKNREHRAIRFAQIGDPKKIKALFPDATAAEIVAAMPAKK